jgi:predicted dehydrogenase
MIKIGLIGTQSLHAQLFARVCNMADGEGKYQFPDTKVVAAYGVDDTPEHIRLTLEKGNIPLAVSSLEELLRKGRSQLAKRQDKIPARDK